MTTWFIEEVEIINFMNNEELSEDWWAVTHEDDETRCYEVRNKQVAKELCKELNKYEDKLSRLIDEELGCDDS